MYMICWRSLYVREASTYLNQQTALRDPLHSTDRGCFVSIYSAIMSRLSLLTGTYALGGPHRTRDRQLSERVLMFGVFVELY